MMELVKRQPHALRLASAALKDDREIVLEAVKQHGDALLYASAALKDDREFMLEAVKQNGYALYTSPGPRESCPERVRAGGALRRAGQARNSVAGVRTTS